MRSDPSGAAAPPLGGAHVLTGWLIGERFLDGRQSLANDNQKKKEQHLRAEPSDGLIESASAVNTGRQSNEFVN